MTFRQRLVILVGLTLLAGAGGLAFLRAAAVRQLPDDNTTTNEIGGPPVNREAHRFDRHQRREALETIRRSMPAEATAADEVREFLVEAETIINIYHSGTLEQYLEHHRNTHGIDDRAWWADKNPRLWEGMTALVRNARLRVGEASFRPLVLAGVMMPSGEASDEAKLVPVLSARLSSTQYSEYDPLRTRADVLQVRVPATIHPPGANSFEGAFVFSFMRRPGDNAWLLVEAGTEQFPRGVPIPVLPVPTPAVGE